jgi:Ras GTPase-activating protein 1
MKHVAIESLKHILGPLIHLIVEKNLSCEVDPSKIDKSEDMSSNWTNLLSYSAMMIEAIFHNENLIPVYFFM